ncbi:F-box/LRR-repeat protein At4g14096-like isoform X5 [Silene latifolia]
MEGNNLPGNILGHTLSLLPSKYAVATSNLSANQLTTDCDFDDSLSIHPQFRFGAPNRNSCFRNFVNRVLVQCKKSQITRFEYSLVTDWINVALYLHKVTKIELSLELGLPFVLRLPELTCQNLTVSKLDCNFILHVPKLVTFPFLKVLFFKEVSFLGDSTLFPSNGELRMDGLNGSLSGSPLLEELVIIGCDWNGSDLFFSNPLPKKLTLDVGIGGVLDQLNGSSIRFNLLSLVYLKYSESVPEQYYISNLDSVVHGHFEVGFDGDEFEDLQDLCNTMLDVIFGVSNCEILYLSGLCLEALTSGDYKLPVFQNLTRLKLGQGYDVSWNDVLLDFLNNSLCLESLTPVQGYAGRNTDDQLDDDCLLGDHPVRSCVSSCLKVISLMDFTSLSGETGMVK